MRDFEEEYKKYINEETPDLWNRIESQLEDREISESPVHVQKELTDEKAENTEKIARETADINLSDRAKDRKISDKDILCDKENDPGSGSHFYSDHRHFSSAQHTDCKNE